MVVFLDPVSMILNAHYNSTGEAYLRGVFFRSRGLFDDLPCKVYIFLLSFYLYMQLL